MACRWFSPDTLLYSTNKTDCHDIAESGIKHHINNPNLNPPLPFHIQWLSYGSFSDNFYNSDGKNCNCVPLILQKNNKFKLK